LKPETNPGIDILVEDKVIVEIKAVKKIPPIYKAQILSYMKLAGKDVGLLINFNVEKLIDGIERFVLQQPLRTQRILRFISVVSVLSVVKKIGAE